jgi:hypothetical protein
MVNVTIWYFNANIKGVYRWDPWSTINIAAPKRIRHGFGFQLQTFVATEWMMDFLPLDFATSKAETVLSFCDFVDHIDFQDISYPVVRRELRS